MASVLGIAIEEIVSFGDGQNDAEFLEMTGRGYAMKNAADLAKASANATLLHTNNEDGVAKQLSLLETQGLL